MSQVRDIVQSGNFISYPTNCIVGVVDDEPAAARAMHDLAGAGFGDGVTVLRGAEAADEIDASGARHGLLARIVRLVQFTTMDGQHAERYEHEARTGHSVMIIHLNKHEDAENVRRILLDHGGHFINWYGRLHFETLDD